MQIIPSEVKKIETILATPAIGDVLESAQFRRFFDRVPIAILVSEMRREEIIVYANPEFERVSGQAVTAIVGQQWDILSGRCTDGSILDIGMAIVGGGDCVGTFKIERADDEATTVTVFSNVIVNDDGTPTYRLAALVRSDIGPQELREEFDRKLLSKDLLLLEIQHRVKNNLQLLTAFMRIEAREARGRDLEPFNRLAGRIESMHLLYALLSDPGADGVIDLGVYLSEVASAVMRAYAVEGIRLDLKVDAYPVSVNVAMPTGLVVNELLTNALKHAFIGREGGVAQSLCIACPTGKVAVLLLLTMVLDFHRM
jgi:two-component sensor histidine kinase